MTTKFSHPEAPRHTEVSPETAKSLRDWARDLTQHGEHTFLTVEGEDAQLSVSKGTESADWDFMISCHESSTDFTRRHTFLTIFPDRIEIIETTTVNPASGQTPEQAQALRDITAEESVLGEEPIAVFDQEGRAKYVLSLLPDGEVAG